MNQRTREILEPWGARETAAAARVGWSGWGREAHGCGCWEGRWQNGTKRVARPKAGLTTLPKAGLAVACRPLISSALTRGHGSAFPKLHRPPTRCRLRRGTGLEPDEVSFTTHWDPSPPPTEPLGSVTRNTGFGRSLPRPTGATTEHFSAWLLVKCHHHYL